MRGLAVTSPQRSPALPDVPTVRGVWASKGSKPTGWLGILVPNGVPPAIIARLNAEIGKVMQSPELKKAMLGAGRGSPAQHARSVRRDAQIRDG